MTFFKSLILAIIATIFLTYMFETSIVELLNVDLYINDKLIEPITDFGISAFIVALITIVTLVIVLSVFGSLFFVGILGVGAIILSLIGLIWPMVLAAFIIWLVTKNSSNNHNPTNNKLHS